MRQPLQNRQNITDRIKMIRIDKTLIPVPAILDTGGKGKLATTQLKADFDNGVRTFKFSSKIYGHKTFKEALKKAQHDKCCFCEAKVAHVSHGDVEHFRPKAAYRIQTTGKLTKPGYYWLAYDFSNLYFSCQICNQKYKENYFPIEDETQRARMHNHNHLVENQLIIDPGREIPENYLYFEQEVVKPKNNSLKGVETILRTGLDRKELNDNRMEYLNILKILAKVATGNSQDAFDAKAHFKILGQSKSLYSLMVRCNFPDLI